MDLQNMTTVEICNAWNSASADLRGCNWHHAGAHRTIAGCIAELGRRGFFVRTSGIQSIHID